MSEIDETVARCPVLSKLIYPCVASHRGGASVYGPENTLYNYRRCVNELQSHILEIDVRRSADGVLVIMHDMSVNRTTNGCGMVSSLTLQQLQGLDAAYNFTPDSGKTFPLRGKGITIPTVREVVAEFSQIPDAIIFFDVKTNGVCSDTLKIVHEFGMEYRCIFGAVGPEANAELMAIKPSYIPAAPDFKSMMKLYMSYLGGSLASQPLLRRWELLGWMVPPGVLLRRLLTPKFVAAIQKQGRLVAVFGGYLDTDEGQLGCLTSGVDIIVTDRPDLAMPNVQRYIAKHGSRSYSPAAAASVLSGALKPIPAASESELAEPQVAGSAAALADDLAAQRVAEAALSPSDMVELEKLLEAAALSQ